MKKGYWRPISQQQPRQGQTRRGCGVPWLLALLLAILASNPSWASSDPQGSVRAPLPRVVGTNLCVDLMLLQLAAPEQILSLSAKSSDPHYSPPEILEQAARYPKNDAQVEEILYLKPDMVIADPFWKGNNYADLFAEQGIRIINVGYPTSWAEGIENAQQLSIRIGRGHYGRALVADTQKRIQQLQERPNPRLALYLRPNGGTAARGTYVDDVMQTLGLRNMASELGLKGWPRMPLEKLIQTQPDLFLLGYFDKQQPLTESGHARHPHLRKILEETHHVHIPSGGWGCGGLELIEIAENLAAQLDQLDQLETEGPATDQALGHVRH